MRVLETYRLSNAFFFRVLLLLKFAWISPNDVGIISYLTSLHYNF